MIDFDDDKKGYSAIIYIMESSNSVVVHFGGFDNLKVSGDKDSPLIVKWNS